MFVMLLCCCGQLYAIKVLKKIGIVEDNDMEQTLTEKRILAIHGNPPFLTRLFASFQTAGNLFFVMELLQGGGMCIQIHQPTSDPLHPPLPTNFFDPPPQTCSSMCAS